MPVFALWSAPRARSTAFFRSMLERGDLLALHEPLEGLVYFGDAEVQGQTFTSLPALLASLINDTDDLRIFLKETTDRQVLDAVLGDARFLAEAQHAFLIRHPAEIAASAHAVIESIKEHDPSYPTLSLGGIGLEALHGLYTAVSEAARCRPVVIDSDDLVTRPEATMAAYCDAVGLPFVPTALTWRAGERPEWRRSARWHKDVSHTSGFEPPQCSHAVTVDTSEDLARFSAHHLPFYEQLRAHRIDVEPWESPAGS